KLAQRIEKPFGQKLLPKLLKRRLQRALSHRLNARDIELIFSPLRINRDAPAREHLAAVDGLETHPLAIAFEDDAVDARDGVLHREVDVAGRSMDVDVADFAFDQNRSRQAGFDGTLDDAGELRDGHRFGAV